MKIFLTMTEAADALGYSHDYFRSNWRSICLKLRAPFPVNHHCPGSRRWRRADMDAYASGILFDPPARPQAARSVTTITREDPSLPTDWTERFRARARSILQQADR